MSAQLITQQQVDDLAIELRFRGWTVQAGKVPAPGRSALTPSAYLLLRAHKGRLRISLRGDGRRQVTGTILDMPGPVTPAEFLDEVDQVEQIVADDD